MQATNNFTILTTINNLQLHRQRDKAKEFPIRFLR